MKKRRIRWSAPRGARQFYTSLLGAERLLAGEYALFLLCTVLFFWTACGMLRGLYEWEFSVAEVLARVIFLTVFVSALVEVVSELLKGKWRTLARLGIVAIGLLWFAFYLFGTKQGESVLTGFQAILGMYGKQWNLYYHTFVSWPVGDVFRMEEALHFAVNLSCFLLVWLARVGKWTMTTVVVPFVVFVSGLLIGLAPAGLWLFLMAFGVCLANAAEYRLPEFAAAPNGRRHVSERMRQFFWVPVGVVFLVLLVIVGAAGKSSAEERVYLGERKLQEKQDEIVKAVTEWEGWQDGKLFAKLEKKFNELFDREGDGVKVYERNYAHLDNRKPVYEDATVLKVALDRNVAKRMYLVGFYADEYADGIWSTDVKQFEEECIKAGFDPEVVSEELLMLGMEKLEQASTNAKQTKFIKGKAEGWMYYAKGSLRKAYLPYFSRAESEELRVEGDSRYVKEKGLTKVPFSTYELDTKKLTNFMSVLEVEWRKNQEKADWEDWYTSYVEEQNLVVPSGMTQVKKVAEEIREGSTVGSGERYTYIVGDAEMDSLQRIRAAYGVIGWLRNWTKYSLELPELPDGEDPVEFFLGTSRQGYCMHYASAATLLLRELGVPARYVSGYVTDEFKKDELTGQYVSIVPDSNAHAWVEIYLEGIGWIPMEVTNGYSTPMAQQGIYLPENAEVTVKENGEIQVTIKEPGATQAPAPGQHAPGNVPQNTGTPTPNLEEQSQTGGVSRPGATNVPQQDVKDDDVEKKDLSVNPIILLFLLLFLGVIFGVMLPISKAYRKARSAADERFLSRRAGRWGNRRRIKWLNRNLYRRLRRKGRILKKYPRDEEYAELLRAYEAVVSYEDREKFLHLAKAAAFSYGDFTDEEVEFCKEVCRRILYVKAYEVEEK